MIFADVNRSAKKNILKIVAIILLIKRMKLKRIERRLATNSMLRGHEYVNEIIHGNPAYSIEMLRMQKQVFLSLCTYFRNKDWLQM